LELKFRKTFGFRKRVVGGSQFINRGLWVRLNKLLFEAEYSSAVINRRFIPLVTMRARDYNFHNQIQIKMEKSLLEMLVEETIVLPTKERVRLTRESISRLKLTRLLAISTKYKSMLRSSDTYEQAGFDFIPERVLTQITYLLNKHKLIDQVNTGILYSIIISNRIIKLQFTSDWSVLVTNPYGKLLIRIYNQQVLVISSENTLEELISEVSAATKFAP
jgi:hypothetical protein